ncbi:MAG: AAA family ATPase [Treponema sp.]|nr:AAA family ATPase [Treponema sp.]
MERALRIEGYRNIGFKDENPHRERLVINNSLKKGELGDLIILIGANNAGKSNVLDALETFGNKQIQERDVTDLYMEEECRKPALTLFARNTEKEDEFAYRKVYQQADEVVYPEDDSEREFQFITFENFPESLRRISDTERNYIGTSKLYDLLKSFSEKYKDEQYTKNAVPYVTVEVFKVLESLQRQYGRSGHWNNFYNQTRNTEIMKEYSVSHNTGNTSYRNILNGKYLAKYGYNFIPSILTYKNNDILNNNLVSDYNNISSNKFFSALFKSIEFDISTIKNAYEIFRKQNNKGVLSQLEKKINKKLKSVADKFNKLYFIEDAVYSFKIDLESERIFFSLFRGEQSISLDYQSTGFKWFFNLFFNLLNSTDLNPGDIIIMDEPATNLHVKGQRELRGFLKEFAIYTDISIVIATHSPFLIDLDYLDEIRVVVNKDNITSIENNFAAVNENDPDSLLPIKDSLTVENHILVNPEEKVVFVEGITDYNYLTAFKILFKKEGITFLPINGVGKTKEECIKITQRLMKIRKKDPILLVDNDKAGNCIKEVNKNNKDFRIISLSEADEKFKTIESLFSDEDKGKFGLVDESGKSVKHASTSTIFKNHILKNEDEVSEETKANFEKLFEILFEELE